MKKLYSVLLVFFALAFSSAQIKVQGVPRTDIKVTSVKKGPQVKAASNSTIDFSTIKYWVGTGSNQAALAIQWNDNKNPDALVWGFRWDGTATGEDMIKAIAKVDKRFYTLLYQGTPYGTAIGGLGFDLDGKGSVGLVKNGNTTYPKYPLNGIINTDDYDFDDFTAIDANDHWQSGWYQGYWSYWVQDATDSGLSYSGVGASTRELHDGSLDLWNYQPDFNSTVDNATTFTPVSVYSAQADFTKGFFMVNEEWFGHTNGSVNFVGDNGQIYYRVYSEKNNNLAFGATTQFGTIYGDKFYFISKQDKDGGDVLYTPGGRLVVANAKTMERIASFNTIGGGDGRSFVGVDSNKAYIGASNGVFVFDIANMKVGDMIDQTGGGSLYAGQIGNMIRTSHYVYAVKQSKGILVIDPKTDKVITTLTGTYISVVQAKDGSVWAAMANKLVKIDERDFSLAEVSIPTGKIADSWGAWNAGSFTASAKDNAIYWVNNYGNFGGGPNIVKFDVTNQTFNNAFAIIPGQTDESGAPLKYKQVPYGAALRVDPVTGDLILNTTENGGSSHYQKNWVYRISNAGVLLDTKTLNDYYWFPAVTVFPDNAAPVVNPALQANVTLSATTVIDLKDKVSDVDNLSSAIVKTVKSNSNPSVATAEINANDELVLTPLSSGATDVVLSFNSNGKVVDYTVSISSSTLGVIETKKLDFQVYPNPAVDYVNIKTTDKIDNVQLYDLNGRMLYNAPITEGKLNVSAYPKGVYIIKVTTGNKIFTEKIIKK